MKARSVTHLQNIKVKDDWETPVFEKIGGLTLQEWCNQLHIHPLLDVCATAANRKCKLYFDKKQDGLKQEWTKDFFGNFPYSNVKAWIKKAYEQHKKHNVDGMILIYSKTDTAFWHDYIEKKAQVYFIRGRVRFLLNGKRPVTINKHGKEVKLAAPYPSCFVIYRKHHTGLIPPPFPKPKSSYNMLGDRMFQDKFRKQRQKKPMPMRPY
tara:strand:+ start:300 stop:926 length:627 start_codon:yes stop_codon:yes gene_type:complete